jgi:hypothetical protein
MLRFRVTPLVEQWMCRMNPAAVVRSSCAQIEYTPLYEDLTTTAGIRPP